MKKRHERNKRHKRTYPRSAIILVLTVIYILLFVLPLFIKQYQGLEVSSGVLTSQIGIDGLSTFIQIFCLIFALTITRVVWVFAWTFVCIVSAIQDYMYHAFHTQVNKYAIAVFLEPKAREAASLVNSDVYGIAFSGFLLAVLGIFMMHREKKEEHNFRTAVITLMLVIGVITINQGGMSTPFPPFNFLTASYQYLYERIAILPSHRKDISEYGATWKPAGDKKDLVIVVVIGESSRGDHFSINGYSRETTPLLEKRKNLVNFKDTRACGVWTRVAVPCLMTRATEKDKSAMYTETTFISVFKKLGFYTSWLSTQGKTSVIYPVTPIAYEAEEHIMLEEQQVLDNTIKDDQLLELVDKRLETQTRPILLVLHTYGSHWQYSARYPKEFKRYTPVCGMTLSRNMDPGVQVDEIKDCYTDHDALVNSYDNSILYIDYVLDEVIKRLENKNALFMFVSDHGESLGEGGRFLHGHEDGPEDWNVPMFWWASDSFIHDNPEKWQALVKKSATPTNQDVIFHSILDCSGVSSPLIDPALSLCHEGDTTQ